MEEVTVRVFWIMAGLLGSLIFGMASFIIKSSISKNATKENIKSKTDLLEKDIVHINKELTACEDKFSILHKRISDLRDSSKEIYVSKELFHQTIKQLNDKLDTILKFVKK